MDWDLTNPYSATPTLDGFVWTNAHDARNNQPPYHDTNGIRSMGYYDDTDLNYYYYMATQFSTSDRWFSPVMTRTGPESRIPDRRHVPGRRLSHRHRQRRPVVPDGYHNFSEVAECRNHLEDLRQH